MTRGRPPTYCEVVGNERFITVETLDKEVQRLEKHRTDCRNRYRQKRDMLKKLRPDLFVNRNGNHRANQQALFRYGVPIGTGFLQETHENGHPSEIEGHSGVREFTLREVLDSAGAAV